MALQLGSKLFAPKPAAPNMRLAGARERRAAVWPTVSIVILLIMPVIFAPLMLTIMNFMLVSLAAAAVLLSNHRLDRRLLAILVPFVLMSFLGLATGVGTPTYEYLKDAWYVANPVLVVLTGYVLYMGKPDLARGLRAFIIGGVIISAWQLRGYFIAPEILFLPAGTIRRIIGTGFYAPVLAVVIFIVYFGRFKEGVKLPAPVAWVLIVIASLAVIGVFSRTALLVVFIGGLAIAGSFAKREWFRLGFPLVLLLTASLMLQLVVDVESDRVLQTFAGKLARSFSELVISESADVREVNLSFRAYETQRALDQFASSGPVAMLFGQGYGATVDLGMALPLQSSETGGFVRHIGYLHNGYMYLLTKVGIVGMLLYVFVLAYLYFVARPLANRPLSDPLARPARLLQACIVTLAATTYIVGGVFNKLDMFPFMLLTGYLLAHLRDEGRDRPVDGQAAA